MESDKLFYTGRNEVINLLLQSYKSAQKARIAMGNRMCAVVKLLARKTDDKGNYVHQSLRDMLIREKIIDEVEATTDSDETGIDTEEAEAQRDRKDLVSKRLATLAQTEYRRLTMVGDKQYPATSTRYTRTNIASPFRILVTFDLALLMSNWYTIVAYEDTARDNLNRAAQADPLYDAIKSAKEKDPTEFVGVGELVIATIVGYCDFTKVYYPSGLISYAGIDVVEGVGRSRRAEHLVDRDYTDRDGKVQTRRSLTFNPDVKTNLVGIAATNMIMLGAPNKNGKPASKYYTIYTDYKNRITQRENVVRQLYEGLSKAETVVEKSCIENRLITMIGTVRDGFTPKHIDRMGRRYMIRRMLLDIYNLYVPMFSNLVWQSPYEEGKLGLVHHGRGYH